jgi:hypothetical protein
LALGLRLGVYSASLCCWVHAGLFGWNQTRSSRALIHRPAESTPLRKCRFCTKEILDASRVCEHCGAELAPAAHQIDPHPGSIPIARAPELLTAQIARVSVVDINMPFASIVGFMVKWAIAAIPAFLILVVIGFLLSVFLGGLARGLLR